MDDKIISCDWGTSSFRIYLIDVISETFLASVENSHGISKIYQEWKTQDQLDKFHFFRSFLEAQVNILQKQSGEDLAHLPIFLSGMASSSIGMHELPYATLPMQLSREGLVWKKFKANDLFQHTIYLISGVKTHNDVMRGEEIQIIGLAHHISCSAFVGIFPGTHSKHIWVKNDHITDFQTYMTGEVFQMLSQHSILKNSVQKEKDVADYVAFQDGILATQQQQLLHNIFSVRTNELIHRTSKSYNFYYLSGLLIGSEIQQLKNTQHPIFLCGGDHLSALYQKGFEVLNIQTQIITSELVEKAVGLGHCKLILK